jgi:hypothetical protein
MSLKLTQSLNIYQRLQAILMYRALLNVSEFRSNSELGIKFLSQLGYSLHLLFIWEFRSFVELLKPKYPFYDLDSFLPIVSFDLQLIRGSKTFQGFRWEKGKNLIF